MRLSFAIFGFGLLSALPVEGFSPCSLQSKPLGSCPTTFRAPVPLLQSTTAEDKLTREDEEILFGNDLGGSIAPNPLDQAKDPLINKLNAVRRNLQSCPQLWGELAKICPEKKAVFDEHMCDEKIDVNFGEMNELVRKSAAAFADLGVKKGQNVAILGENSARWLMADHGIQLLGAASAVRGADAPIEELLYIYEHSESAGLAVVQGPRLLQKLAKNAAAKGLPALGLQNKKNGSVKTIVLMHREKKSDEDIAKLSKEIGVKVVVLGDMINETAPIDPSRLPSIDRKDTSTIVYTSGTTGNPKGVVLTHGNLIHQLVVRLAPSKPFEESEPLPGETMVSLLPVWHITERAFELWMFSRGCNVAYSSIRTFKNDLAKHRPHWMVLVPRVLEKIALGVQDKFSSGSAAVKALSNLFTATSGAAATQRKVVNDLTVGNEKPGLFAKLKASATLLALAPLNAVGDKLVWSKVQDGFGGRLKVIISGGSALAGSLESFYETAGMTICVGYGLTECAPLIAFRRTDKNLVTAGSVGRACESTELRVVDPDSKASESERPALPDGEVGVVIARGPQVMKGYYKNEEATAKAVDKFGWFDTGDLGKINPTTGDLILTGRAKDTIVLSNGENIEPGPIEDSILGVSPSVEQVMLTGQDGRRLVAILVLRPEELAKAELLDKQEAKTLQAAYDNVNNPTVSADECAEDIKVLNEASEKLRSNKSIEQTLMVEVKQATSMFRSWEQVGGIYVTLEPFAMANGQLTQSYKVKRASVIERYGDLLPK